MVVTAANFEPVQMMLLTAGKPPILEVHATASGLVKIWPPFVPAANNPSDGDQAMQRTELVPPTYLPLQFIPSVLTRRSETPPESANKPREGE